MTPITRAQAHALLTDGVCADLAASAAIAQLLERQFEAAVRHRSAELACLSAELEPALAAMEARRVQRVNLVRALHGPSATMAAMIASLPEPGRSTLASGWMQLENLVLDCKRKTERNAALLTEQFSVMQRVLHGEHDLYAPR